MVQGRVNLLARWAGIPHKLPALTHAEAELPMRQLVEESACAANRVFGHPARDGDGPKGRPAALRKHGNHRAREGVGAHQDGDCDSVETGLANRTDQKSLAGSRDLVRLFG